MKALKERILRDGKCFEGGILKVDNFINHQMDPILMKSIAVEFVRRFASTNINKVMTIEASGIAPAIMVGYLLELPVVFAKKKKPVTMENMLTTSVYSFTKDRSYDVCVSKDFLQKGDRVLFIDDFLANGNAAKGIIDLVEKAGAELAGIDIYVYGLGKTSFTGITGIAGNIDSIFCIISNNVDYSSDSICSVKSGRSAVQYFNTFDFGNIDSSIGVISIQAFAIFQKNEIIIRQSIQTQCCPHAVGHT